jgi:hypothetical protein
MDITTLKDSYRIIEAKGSPIWTPTRATCGYSTTGSRPASRRSDSDKESVIAFLFALGPFAEEEAPEQARDLLRHTNRVACERRRAGGQPIHHRSHR